MSRTFFCVHISWPDDSSSVSISPTRKVIIYFQTNEGFTLFNIYLTSVKVEKKLGKSLVVSIIFITLLVGNQEKEHPEAVSEASTEEC